MVRHRQASGYVQQPMSSNAIGRHISTRLHPQNWCDKIAIVLFCYPISTHSMENWKVPSTFFCICERYETTLPHLYYSEIKMRTTTLGILPAFMNGKVGTQQLRLKCPQSGVESLHLLEVTSYAVTRAIASLRYTIGTIVGKQYVFESGCI